MKIGRHRLQHIIPIVGDGGIGNPDLGDGRIIPVLILDCENHSAFRDLILIHSDTPPGDVVATWRRHLFDNKQVYLTLDFKRPVETSVSLCFDVAKKGGLVDWIMYARGVYLQPMESGAKVSEGINRPKIIVEIPPSATLPGWEKIYRNSLVKSYVKSGCARGQAKEAAAQHLTRLRELWSMRRPASPKASADSNPVNSAA